MKRLLLNVLAVLSVLACAALVALENSSVERYTRSGFSTPWGYFFFNSRDGRAWLDGPPPYGHRPARVISAVERMRNGDVEWGVYYRDRDGGAVSYLFARTWAREDGAMEELQDLRLSRRELVRPLLDALRSPERFEAAHACLMRALSYGEGSVAERGGKLHVDSGGLQFAFDPARAERVELLTPHPAGPSFPPLRDYTLNPRADAVRIDPADRWAVRAFWHDRLNVTWAAAPYWPFILATTALPAARIVSFWKRKWTVRRRECLACGYDLRATPERCPECGTAATESGHSSSGPH